MNFEENFLNDIKKRLLTYKLLGDKTFEQLEEKDFYYLPSTESNSISIIVQHVYGNMLSRFTDFLSEDGEKPSRNRDAEFVPMYMSKQDILSSWDKGWDCVLTALNGLKPEDLMKTVYIRMEGISVYDAMLRQLAHYAYHIGQIVFIGKLIKNEDWKTLSIAKGQSNQYNAQMKQSI